MSNANAAAIILILCQHVGKEMTLKYLTEDDIDFLIELVKKDLPDKTIGDTIKDIVADLREE